MTIHERTNPIPDGEPNQGVRESQEQGRRRFLETLAASALGFFTIGGTLQAGARPRRRSRSSSSSRRQPAGGLRPAASGPGGGGGGAVAVAVVAAVAGGGGGGGGGGGIRPTRWSPRGSRSSVRSTAPLTSLRWSPSPRTDSSPGCRPTRSPGPRSRSRGATRSALPPTSDLPTLTLVSQGQIFLQGLFAQPGPGEFIIETFTLGPLTGTGFILFNRQ